MLTPPFRSTPLPSSALTFDGRIALRPDPAPRIEVAPPADPAPHGRLRMTDLDPHLHCSVIGTCLSRLELRKLMARLMDIDGCSDLELHHEAVRLTAERPDVARRLHKALDRRHEASVQRFARAHAASELAALWDQALKSGEVPGAYWAVLTHRRTTPELRQQVFGDVHMLSHLMGASNRADIRRLMALEQENGELRERLDRNHERVAQVAAEREVCRAERDALRLRVAELESASRPDAAERQAARQAEALASAVALQTQRREDAERSSQALAAGLRRQEEALSQTQRKLAEIQRELAAAEAELRRAFAEDDSSSVLADVLAGRRLLYVGGRPSSSAAIRNLVARHGGEYQRHDGGVEDRKGLLAAALAWADVVAFPVDCVDHDSALALKRRCLRAGTRFVPLRNASVASFAAAMTGLLAPPG